MMEQWNCGMMDLKITEFKVHIFSTDFLVLMQYFV